MNRRLRRRHWRMWLALLVLLPALLVLSLVRRPATPVQEVLPQALQPFATDSVE